MVRFLPWTCSIPHRPFTPANDTSASIQPFALIRTVFPSIDRK